jgi:hypothetical protein
MRLRLRLRQADVAAEWGVTGAMVGYVERQAHPRPRLAAAYVAAVETLARDGAPAEPDPLADAVADLAGLVAEYQAGER